MALGRITRGIAGGLAILVSAGTPMHKAAAESVTKVTFQFENAKLQPARYVIELNPDGSGRFHSEVGPAPSTDVANLPPEGQDRPIHLSKDVTQRVFTAAKKSKYFSGQCDSGMDNIAFQGKKTLSASGPGGQGSCTYNYSKDAQIEWLTQELQGVASTLEEGRRLQLEYEHSKLALDSELANLQDLVHAGEATQLANIAPILQQITSDDAVVEHAQRRARALLLLAAAEQDKGK